jgi:hypothetical protein
MAAALLRRSALMLGKITLPGASAGNGVFLTFILRDSEACCHSAGLIVVRSQPCSRLESCATLSSLSQRWDAFSVRRSVCIDGLLRCAITPRPFSSPLVKNPARRKRKPGDASQEFMIQNLVSLICTSSSHRLLLEIADASRTPPRRTSAKHASSERSLFNVGRQVRHIRYQTLGHRTCRLVLYPSSRGRYREKGAPVESAAERSLHPVLYVSQSADFLQSGSSAFLSATYPLSNGTLAQSTADH